MQNQKTIIHISHGRTRKVREKGVPFNTNYFEGTCGPLKKKKITKNIHFDVAE